MKKALLLISTIATLQAQAQNLGVNTLTPHASAIMDITHTNRGLLIPRLPLVDVNDVTTIPSPALSLLIFNTATAGVAPNDVKPGFYYFNGTKWVGIGTGNAWELLGNTGTNAATNFIGTTDAQDLVFKRNSVQSGLISSANTSFGEAALNPLTSGIFITAIGRYALALNTSGNDNTAVGNYSLSSNTNGSRNTAIGNGSLASNLGGVNNTAVGYRAIESNSVGSNNTGIGEQSLFTTNSGANNTALGFQAGITNTIGNNNVFIGSGADVLSNNLINASAIGYNSKVGASNSMILGGTGLDAVNVGINNVAPANKLEITQGTAGNSGLRFTNLPNATALSTDVNGDVIPTALNPANSLYWGLTGNSGTTPATNFVGTTDAQDLVFKTNSVENMRVLNSNGNVGIGTNAPLAPLDVNGVIISGSASSTASSVILVGKYGGLNNILTLFGTEQSSGSPVLSYGIKANSLGTASFESTHDLTPINKSALVLGGNGGFGNAAFRLYGAPSQTDVVGTTIPIPELMRVNSNGNLGIGTTAPTYKLHVANGSVKVDGTANTGANGALLMFGLNNSTDIGYVGDGSTTDNNMYLYSYSNDVRIGTGVLSSASNSIYLDQVGNTGIGTIPATSSAKLDVVSTTSGFAMPRMTSAQRKAIVAPIAGLDVYDLTLKGHYTFDGTKWDCSDNPAGSVNYFANATAPNGYLECNGQSVSTTTYAELFAAIGYLYGGAGASFNVPDLRGEFVRGASNGRAGVDVGRVIGTAQPATAIRAYIDGDAPLNAGSAAYLASINSDGSGGLIAGSSLYMYVANTAAPAAYYGSFTVKPRNVAMLPCIKF